MSSWDHLITIEELPPGGVCEVVVKETVLAVYNLDGEFKVLDGICPHQGGPLGKGSLSGCVVTCPWHGWQFDVTTGKHCLNERLCHPTYPVLVEEDGIYIELPES